MIRNFNYYVYDKFLKLLFHKYYLYLFKHDESLSLFSIVYYK